MLQLEHHQEGSEKWNAIKSLLSYIVKKPNHLLSCIVSSYKSSKRHIVLVRKRRKQTRLKIFKAEK